jgi:glutamate-ammonia-ligase adenylyltransferase
LPGLTNVVAPALAACADPERAPRLATDLLTALDNRDKPRFAAIWQERPHDVVRVLAALCGAAPFLVPFLARLPELGFRLLDDDFSAPRSLEDYRRRLNEFLRQHPDTDEGDSLRRFKYVELARITVRELSADLVPPEQASETLGEISHLADALLARAMATAAHRLEASHGPPVWRGAIGEKVALAFCALGLGKLGAEELNYSSDVDLVYVFESPAEAHDEAALSDGPGGLSPVEYFTRLAQSFGRLTSDATKEGFLYRVDLDLRPEGTLGPLVVSSAHLANYYDVWAATWEKAAFTKARPVAGDERFGWQTIRAIDPMIYRRAMDFTAVAAIREMKDKIEQAKERSADTFNVKIGSGGIRDVEFVAQALQLLHGGRIPQLRQRSTEGSLVAQAQVGVLPDRDRDGLLSAYRFLRRTEHRLQMEAERQTHRLPSDPLALRRIARAMGFTNETAVEDFDRALDSHRRRIREIFVALFSDNGTERILSLFQRNVPTLLLQPATEGMIRELAASFAREIDAGPNPERSMNNLDRFIHGVGTHTFYYGLLLDRPELVPRLAALFAASEYFSGYLATHPRLIEPIFSDPNVLLLSRNDLLESLAEIRRGLAAEGSRDEVELDLDTLRRFHNRELLNVGLLDLAGKITLGEAETALTEIAEVCVNEGLELARREMQRTTKATNDGEFLVVGMGKVGSRELTYGSDLDVIFLYDVADGDDVEILEAQEYFVRVAQKFIWTQRTRTGEGVCYDIDARLRPSGSQGMLVTSLGSFEQYHAKSTEVWERQALLRARPIAGSDRLGGAFDALRLEILRRPLPRDIGAEIHRIRLRVESELAQETKQRHDFKTGYGGLNDIESVVQFLQLRYGAEHEDLLVVDSVANQIPLLEELSLLNAKDATTLLEGWQFLRLLSSRLRIVENRSISDLDEERGDLDSLAQRLGYASPQRAGGARRGLLADYRRFTSTIREVYLRVIGVGVID